MMMELADQWQIFTVMMIFFFIYSLLKFTKYCMQKFGNLQTSIIPGIKGNGTLTYISIITYFFRNSSAACPMWCVGLQTLVGLCYLYGKHGLFRFHLLFKPVIFFFKAEAVEVVLSSLELLDKSKEYRLIQPLMGTGLVTSQGKKWKQHRKLLRPVFHLSIMDGFIPVFQEQANVLISKIKYRIKEPFIDIAPLVSLCTLDVICETIMGISMNIQKGENRDYLNALHEIEETIANRILQPWLYPNIIFNLTPTGRKFNSNLHLVHQLHEQVLKQKMEKMTNEKINLTPNNKPNKFSFQTKIRKPFIELLLEYHLKDPSFTEKDISDEIATIICAGHETTATTISFVFYCLGIHPDIQREVHEELDTIFTNEQNENISLEDLTKMKYLECVIKETLRLYPTVPFITRENKQPFKVLNHSVNRGTMCIIFIWALHRDPVSFPDPEKFNPKRFLPENSTGRNPHAFIPFSSGPRNCIGQRFAMMEMKTVLACVLRHFRIKSLDARDQVLVSSNLSLRNVHPLRLKFERK